jgi:hypothetical protein
MTVSERKHLLLVACTIDRLQLALLRDPPRANQNVVEKLIANPWFDVIAGVLIPVLPRRLRLIASIVRTWQKRMKG